MCDVGVSPRLLILTFLYLFDSLFFTCCSLAFLCYSAQFSSPLHRHSRFSAINLDFSCRFLSASFGWTHWMVEDMHVRLTGCSTTKHWQDTTSLLEKKERKMCIFICNAVIIVCTLKYQENTLDKEMGILDKQSDEGSAKTWTGNSLFKSSKLVQNHKEIWAIFTFTFEFLL